MKLAPLVVVLVALGLVAGCSSKRREPQPEAETAPVTSVPTPAAAPAPAPVARAPAAAPADRTVPADFPAECAAYAALIDKLKQCDAIGAGRDGLVSAYSELRAAWPTVPAVQRASVAAQCKSQADSLRNAAAATCSW